MTPKRLFGFWLLVSGFIILVLRNLRNLRMHLFHLKGLIRRLRRLRRFTQMKQKRNQKLETRNRLDARNSDFLECPLTFILKGSIERGR